MGFSAGARNCPMFHWARNILRKMSDEEKLDFRVRQSYAFGFFWNLLRHRLHKDVMDDWKKWTSDNVLPAMHPSWESHADNWGPYDVPCGDKTFTYKKAELAPPSGVMAQNYAR